MYNVTYLLTWLAFVELGQLVNPCMLLLPSSLFVERQKQAKWTDVTAHSKSPAEEYQCLASCSASVLRRQAIYRDKLKPLQSLTKFLVAFNPAFRTCVPATTLSLSCSSSLQVPVVKTSCTAHCSGGKTEQDPASIHMICEWEDGWMLWKPSGVAVYGSRPNRAGMTLEQWSRKHLNVTNDVLAAVGTTEGGIVVQAKPHVKKGMLGEAAAKVQCVWELLVKGSPVQKAVPQGGSAAALWSALQVLESTPSKTFAQISKLCIHTNACVATGTICKSLEQMGCPVIGSATAKAPGVRGLQLALVEASIPIGMLSHDASACRAVHETPRKFQKLMRREALFHYREEGLALPKDQTEVVCFRGLKLTVAPGLLRPRDSSACLVDAAVAYLQANAIPLPPRLLDLGCGSGALVLAATLDKEMPPRAANVGVDIDKRAILFARQNAADLGIPQETQRVKFFVADFTRLHLDRKLYQEAFGIILSNPPFFGRDKVSKRVCDEREFTLSSGESGFEFYDAICSSIVSCTPPILSPGGRLIFQLPFGPRAKQAVAEIAARHGASLVDYITDQRGVQRGVAFQWNST